MPLTLDLMPLEDKPQEPAAPKTIVVRYGYLKQIGEFQSELTTKVGCGTKLVCKTERGTELAEMLTTTCSNGGCNKSITREKMLEYIDNSGGREYPFAESGRILRVATTQDLAEQAKLDENKKRDLNLARELVTQHRLPMKIVEVEYLLGGERVMFYFTSENRVDFRSLVRDLAHHLHTRIELRQVGARDEARLTADYEKCGQHCCCKQFLKVLTPISMRAAKVQKATLDPAKISGRCGRLMCCLRYEDETYEELRKKLPKRNTRVRTEAAEAWVIDGQILTQLVLVQYDDGKREAVPMEKIQAFDLPKPKTPEGRTMQSPNDRPPMPMGGPGGGGPGGPRPMRGPRPQAQPQGQPQDAAPGAPRPQGGPNNQPRGNRPPLPPRQGGPNQQQAQGPKPRNDRGPKPPRPQGNNPKAPPPPPMRPKPGQPLPDNGGDPLAQSGPTGGDLNPGTNTPPQSPEAPQ